MIIPVHRVPDRSCKAKGREKAVVVAGAIVDDDRGYLAQHFWTLFCGYAVRRSHRNTIFMHHDVVGRVAGMDVSHENADKLDNRRANLRHATRSDNMLNEADAVNRSRRSCPYRGVTRDDRSRSLAKPWRGKVTVHGKIYQTRRFATPEEARDALARLRTDLRIRQMPATENA
jgi:hypothetical protein